MKTPVVGTPQTAPPPMGTASGNTTPVATPTVAAAGNIGLSTTQRSAFDRAWEDSWVPPAPEKPRPPMYALQLAGNTELVRQVNTLLYTKDVSVGDLQSLMDLLSTKVMELSINGEMMSVKDRQNKIQANLKEREKEFAIAKEKAIQAEKDKEWKKFTDMLKSVISVVVSAVVLVAGVMTANPLLAAYGAYLLVNATMDVIDSVRAYQGKDPIGFRLSVGELAGWIAKQAGADEETQMWVNVGTEIAFGLAVGGGASAMGAAKTLSTAATTIKRISQAAQIAQGLTNIGQAILKMQIADNKYEQAQVKSRLDLLQLQYDQLQKQLEKSQDLVKTLNEAIGAIWDSAGDRLKTAREAQDRVWGGGRRNMV